jgi:phosphoglycerol transferase MdoB-like AlkP superfamily enzyme
MRMDVREKMQVWRQRPGRFVLPVLLAAIFVLLTGLIDGNPGVAPGQWYARPMHLLANALPALLFALLLLAMTRRALLSFGLAFLAQGIVYAVNALKVKNLGTPLMPADFRMIGQLRGEGAHLLGSYLPHSVVPYLALVGGVLIVTAFARYEPALFARKTRGRRMLSGAVLVLLLGTLLGGVPVWSTVYDRDRLGMQPWSASSNASHNGVITTLMQFRLQDAGNRQKPDPVAAMQFIASADDALRARMQRAADNDGQRPDIIVVQSESFFDPAILNGYRHEDFTPNLHRLAQSGSTGRLHVPTFGGGTIRTEFEVLTGLSLRYFDNMQFPYLQMNARVVPGMVRTLRAQGYTTIAVHGNDGGFWNRATAFKAIGFDRFITKPQFPADAKVDGQYMADSAMTDEIMAQLKDAGPPQFIFAISMEAHGPYNDSPGVDEQVRDAIPVPPGVEGEARVALQNYIYHMRHADEELGRLADLVARRERPTLIMFYGDHLPALVDAYNASGFRDGKSMLLQSVPWLLVDPQHAVQAEHEDLAAWMLPGKLLERAGIHDDAYFALTQILAPQLAALTHAPDAPLVEDSDMQKRIDASMANLSLLRMKGKLDKLLPVFNGTPMDAAALQLRSSAEEAAASGVQQ